MKKLFFLFVMCLVALTMQAQPNSQYVDLGLPSGTLWKSTNEVGGYYSFDDAYNKWGKQVPNRDQWRELWNYCLWIWAGNGYKIIGGNGASIFLPGKGYLHCDDRDRTNTTNCKYWTSIRILDDDDDAAYIFTINPDLSDEDIVMGCDYRCIKLPIRLIQNKNK